jgi:hypothetical protein
MSPQFCRKKLVPTSQTRHVFLRLDFLLRVLPYVHRFKTSSVLVKRRKIEHVQAQTLHIENIAFA